MSAYVVLITAAFSVMALAVFMYISFGDIAIKAVAPFVGTIGLTLLAAHLLDKRNDAEDAAAAAARSAEGGPRKAPPRPMGEGERGAAASGQTTALPKRRRVAD